VAVTRNDPVLPLDVTSDLLIPRLHFRMPVPRSAIILLSGGMDSAVTLALARREGFAAHALSFRYGQRHAVELEAAGRVAAAGGAVSHRVVTIDLAQFGGSALTADIPLPRDRALHEIGTGVPITYVPARNTIFLAYALALAEVTGAHDLFIGVNVVDYSGYPDCRPEFIAAFERAARLGTTLGDLTIHAPLASLSKADIIRRATALGVDLSLTSSCYDPDERGRACGRCDACVLRREGFRAAGVDDPTRYQE
jgi:7-cyano-7-deazaguanine synthase